METVLRRKCALVSLPIILFSGAQEEDSVVPLVVSSLCALHCFINLLGNDIIV